MVQSVKNELTTIYTPNATINLLLGILGGVLGGWVFALFGLAASGLIGSLITSTVGAILVLWIASLFSKSK